MTSRLPPLQSLRAFDAAARHLSFTRAAQELNLTHGAISHQMKALEAQLGVALFRREGRRLLLTDAGQLFAIRIRTILAELAESVSEIAGVFAPQALTVSVLPAFAALWLIPRLADFHARHPEIDVNLRATQALADVGRDGVDLAIRFGAGRWPGLEAERLLEEEVFPVCSPRFNGGALPRRPSELAHHVLLRNERDRWSPWLAAAGRPAKEPQRGPIYSDANLLLQAAAAGHGIALARGAMAAADLAAGRLVRLFSTSVRLAFAYHLVYPKASAALPKVAAFRAWIVEAARASSAALAPPSQDEGAEREQERDEAR